MIETIRTDLSQYVGEYESFIDSAPEMLEVALMLLKCDINAEERRKICGVVSSFVISAGVMPKEIYGPYCYCEQIVAAFNVLRGIRLFRVMIDGDTRRRFARAYSKSLEIINLEERRKILEFYGIREKKCKKTC